MELKSTIMANAARVEALANRRAALCAEISAFAALPDNFDGYEGHAPAQQDVDNAVSFIAHIPDAGVDGVKMVANGGGEVEFEWEQALRLEINFMDGNISFYGDMPNGERLNGDATYDENAIPENLQQILSVIFNENPA